MSTVMSLRVWVGSVVCWYQSWDWRLDELFFLCRSFLLLFCYHVITSHKMGTRSAVTHPFTGQTESMNRPAGWNKLRVWKACVGITLRWLLAWVSMASRWAAAHRRWVRVTVNKPDLNTMTVWSLAHSGGVRGVAPAQRSWHGSDILTCWWLTDLPDLRKETLVKQSVSWRTSDIPEQVHSILRGRMLWSLSADYGWPYCEQRDYWWDETRTGLPQGLLITN